jgi:1,4-alpha-glucan branching enzyme
LRACGAADESGRRGQTEAGNGPAHFEPAYSDALYGEEAAAQTPFLFFADWKGEAADLTREGRRKELAHFNAFSSAELRERIPDPCDEATFMASKLDWEALDQSALSREFGVLTQELLRIRRENCTTDSEWSRGS